MRDVDPHKFHEAVRGMYAWSDVAERTERVYSRMTRTQVPPLIERLRRFDFLVIWSSGMIRNNPLSIATMDAACGLAKYFALW